MRPVISIKSILGFCLAGVLLQTSQVATADWSEAGVQISCIPDQGTFEILPDDVTSDDAPDAVHENPGFKKLPQGASHLRCNLGRHYHLKAQIDVMSPGNGQCEGAGVVRINSLSVDGVELFPSSLFFDFGCQGEDQLTSVHLNAQPGGVELIQCVIKYKGLQPDPESCKSSTIDVKAISAANAKSDHDLADVTIQNAQLATMLPAGNDLSAFGEPISALPNVPLCAHWRDSFINFVIGPTAQRQGRIAGQATERVYLHKTNPQLCESQEDDDCKPAAYVLPGDRVDVGFICGAWSYVQHVSRLRGVPNTPGWVETTRLYSVDPMPRPMPTLLSSPPQTGKSTDKDDGHGTFMDAVQSGDLEEVRRLAKGGALIDGQNNDGQPLQVAIQMNNPDMVKTLLDIGAQVNAHSMQWQCSLPLNAAASQAASEEIFQLLIKSGADIGCRSGNTGRTVLMWVSGFDRLAQIDELQYGSGSWANSDTLTVIRRLLKAGADPNEKGLDGSTALFFTIAPNNVDIAEALLQGGADPNVSRPDINYPDVPNLAQYYGHNPLMAAVISYGLLKDTTLAKVFLEHGANPNVREPGDIWLDEETGLPRTNAGETPLSKAAALGYFSLTRLLLEHGADPRMSRLLDGKRPAQIAKDNGHMKIAALISQWSAMNANPIQLNGSLSIPH